MLPIARRILLPPWLLALWLLTAAWTFLPDASKNCIWKNFCASLQTDLQKVTFYSVAQQDKSSVQPQLILDLPIDPDGRLSKGLNTGAEGGSFSTDSTVAYNIGIAAGKGLRGVHSVIAQPIFDYIPPTAVAKRVGEVWSGHGYNLQPLSCEERQMAVVSGVMSAIPVGVIAKGAAAVGTQSAKALSNAAKSGNRAPDFIVSPGGTAFPVPKGAVGPSPVRTGKGFEFVGGSGGHGFSSQTTEVRFMNPITIGKYQYPTGYASYGNVVEQTINPYTGQTISKSNPWWHIPTE